MRKLILVISLAGLLLVKANEGYAVDIEAVLDDAAGASAFSVKDSGSTEVAHIDSDGNMVIKGGMRLDAGGLECTTAENLIVDGKVGIGTTEPGAKLEVAGQVKITGGNPGAGKVLTSDANGLATWAESSGSLPLGTAGQTLRHDGTGWKADSLLFNNGSKIGIGTTSPECRLHIKSSEIIPVVIEGSSSWVGFEQRATTLSGKPYIYWHNTANDEKAWIHLDATNHYLDFYYNTDRMVLTNGGKVGIGTTTPEGSLHIRSGEIIPVVIEGSGSWVGFEQRATTLSGKPYIYWHNTANNEKAWIHLDAQQHILDFYYNGDRMVIKNNGQVGIGTTSPGNILTIVQNSATDPIADAWTTYSSRRWKENIQPITDALEKVRRLRGVTFDWKADGKHDVGMIAEEVGEVFPELVTYEENGLDARSLDYARLTAVLVEAIKEQQAQIETLRTELGELKAKLNAR